MRAGPLLVLLGLSLALVACGAEETDPVETPPDQIEFEGRVQEVARSAGTTLIQDDDGRMWSVSTGGQHHLGAGPEGPSGRLEILPGLRVRVVGAFGRGERIQPDSILIMDSPPLLVSQPRAGTVLSNPVIRLEGHTEGGRPVRFEILAGEEVLVDGTVASERVGARRYGPFRRNIPLPTYEIDGGLTISLQQDGSDEDEAVRIDVGFAGERNLNLYFPSRGADPERLRCDTVYPVAERADVLLPPARVIEMMIDGPPVVDRRREYFSDLSAFSGVNEVVIEGATARIDLGARVGEMDSCSTVAAIEQIRRTLKDSFGIGEIEVTVDGEPLDLDR